MWEIEVTSELVPADLPTMGWSASTSYVAGNSHFPCGRIFISSFSEPLDINIEGLNSLLLGIQLFIQIYFDGLCQQVENTVHISE